MKRGISPVIAVILLLSITVIISVMVFNFTEDYFSDSQEQIDSGNLIFEAIGNYEVYSTLDETYLQLSGPINISNVILEGNDCSDSLNGYYNSSYLNLNLTSCNSNLETTTPLLTLELTDNSVLQFTLNIKKDVSSDRILTKSPIFISTWNTSAISNSSSNATQIRLPLESSGTYNFIVDWGDGSNDTITTWNQGATTHNYSSAGVYTLKITGQISGWRFSNGGDRLKISDISNWGSLNLGNNGGYFYGAANLDVSAKDRLNLSGTTSLFRAFRESGIGDVHFNNWKTENITNMGSLFLGATNFNSDLSNWDVGKVSSMGVTFYNNQNFNSDLSNWDVSNVTTFFYTFYNTTNFNSDLSNWNVSNVVIMEGMFMLTYFNSDLSNWDVRNVRDANFLFLGANNFNNANLSNWNVSSMELMAYMFSGTNFSGDISSWDTSSAINMSGLFSDNPVFNVDISSWNTSNVTDMSWMFENTTSFNQDLSSWDVDQVTRCIDYDNLASSWILPKPGFTC